MPPQWKPLMLLGAVLPLAACVPAAPPPASQYHAAAAVSRLPLVFVPGHVQLVGDQDAQLRGLGQRLPVQAQTALRASGPLAPARTAAVARLLHRAVQSIDVAGMPPDQALLVIAGPAIVADACRGSGPRMLGSLWPGNDDVPPRLLPAGCATEVDIAAQTTRPQDLLYGRALPPGAATPFAAAIERYYHRNDPPQSNAGQSGSQAAGSSGGQSSEAEPASGSTPAVLQGPLPQPGH